MYRILDYALTFEVLKFYLYVHNREMWQALLLVFGKFWPLNLIPQMSHPDDVPYSVQVNAGTVPPNRPQVLSMCPLHFKVLTARDLMLYNVWSCSVNQKTKSNWYEGYCVLEYVLWGPVHKCLCTLVLSEL